MANENNEICDLVKKCKILLLDVAGTTTSISFVKKDLVTYAEENVQKFLDSQWESDAVKAVVAGLRKLALEDKEGSVEGAVEIPAEDAPKEDQIAGLVKSVKWQISWERQAGPLKELQGLIWQQGYDSGDLKGHVFEDVSPALKQWRSVDGKKVYVFSSGSVLSQKLLFGKSTAGDLQPLIDGYFDTAVGGKQEAASYTNIAKDIGCKAEEILYINDMLKEAEGARSAGLAAALVARAGNEPLPADVAFPLIRSLAELSTSNKRKPEPDSQHEEHPAKILKTDTEESVKPPDAQDTPTKTVDTKESVKPPDAQDTPTKTVDTKASDVPEKMDVEEPEITDAPQAAAKEEIQVEELTDANDAAGEPVIDVEPVVIDTVEEKAKVEEKQTEKIDKEIKEATDGEAAVPVAGVTPPTAIIEIKEISQDKQLAEVADIVEDLKPVIEEPTVAEEMETLKNVGDVLEKECDEILSKVQDVTNLETISVKPMLNSIAEETMETDNTDSNDIVDRILDTELEMEQCADIDPNTVSEITDDPKSEIVKENCTKDETLPAEATENKTTVNSVEKTEETMTEETKTQEEPQSKVDSNLPEESQTKVDSKVPEEATVTKENETIETKEKVAVETAAPSAEKDEVKPVEDQNGDAVTKDTEEVKVKPDAEEPQVNGKTNGNGDVTLNGDGKDEELSTRLNVEDEKKVNGANGDAAEVGQGDAPAVDVKAKCGAEDTRPSAGPQDQPTEA